MSDLSDFLPTAVLVLETGEVFPGIAIGANQSDSTGTLCFNTAMTGYQEAITDPSYVGQLLVFSFPHIGNVGTNEADQENEQSLLQGVIVGQLPTQPSNYRSQMALNDYLIKRGILGIAQVDTRALIMCIRKAKRAINAVIQRLDTRSVSSGQVDWRSESHQHKLQSVAIKSPGLTDVKLDQVSCKVPYEWQEDLPMISPLRARLRQNALALNVVVMDFGVKHSILRVLKTLGCRVWVVPFGTTATEMLSFHPDAIVLSNGPGDPRSIPDAVLHTLKKLVDHQLPMFGICFGYQLLALLHGAEVIKLPCGHHGNNHPVQVLDTKDILITSQNHEFAVNEVLMPACLIPTHRSLFDGSLEGFRVRHQPILAVQFHPEAGPGPTDALTLFHDFFTMVESHQQRVDVLAVAHA